MTHDRARSADPEGPEVDPERVGLLWIGADQAVIVRWDDEPVVEHVPSGVTPRRRPAGSVRRGPARPEGGGKVHGHGTEAKHERELRQFLQTVAGRLSGMDAIEVAGRGTLPDRFAELVRRYGTGRDEPLDVTTRVMARRPSDAQLKARLRKLTDTELPRRRVGRYRLPAQGTATRTGRPLRPAAGRRTLRPAAVPEWRDIDQQVEAMLRELDEGAEATT